MKRHIYSVHEDHREEHKCETCGKLFSEDRKLKVHKKTIHEGLSANKKSINEEGQKVCTTCGKIFSHERSLNDHIKIVHEKAKEVICTECGKLISQRKHLKKHMQTVHGLGHEGLREHKCDLCEADFRDSTDLKEHK